MFEKVNEPVEVLVGFKRRPGAIRVLPYRLNWRGKQYKLDVMGLHHPARKGVNRIHLFEFTSGNTKFKVEMDSETLEWRLVEIYHDYSR